jgi:RHH-type proline utilization regulon transcriptional repressor/proline dehydrogenase/delta 1-pyrroline-5-carboxylate dehydrogenase
MSQSLSDLRHRIRAASHADEPDLVAGLLDGTLLSVAERDAVRADAIAIVEACRGRSHKAGTLDAFLQEFGLSNDEGIALMCLAEALLRVPDDETADRLIAEKIRSGNWGAHKGRSASRFVNASVWGLMLTGRIVRLDADITEGTDFWMQRLVNKLGEPVVRQAVRAGDARSWAASMSSGARSKRACARDGRATVRGYALFLRHARRGGDDRARRRPLFLADAYRGDRADQPRADAAAANPGISVKLSALHPRYEVAQAGRIMDELFRACARWRARRRAWMGLNVDAEEADRLGLSLVFEAVLADPSLSAGTASAWSCRPIPKRASDVIDGCMRWGAAYGPPTMVRLVKGAYWDAEIKHAQVEGLADFPVFTRKAASDVSYLGCARKLLGMTDRIYPQVRHPQRPHRRRGAGDGARISTRRTIEFQRLHGMGEAAVRHLLGKERRCAETLADLCAGGRRIATSWPIWCAGCWRTAPILLLRLRGTLL